MAKLHKLNALKVQHLKPGTHGDGGGLSLRVSANGSRSWIFRYMLNGKAHEVGLGSLADVTLSEAREKAREMRNQTREGIDPLAARRAQRHAASKIKTFRECALEYWAWRASAVKESTVKIAKSDLIRRVFPVIGDVPVADVDRKYVLDVLKPIWRDVPVRGKPIRSYIERILDYAAVHGYRDDEKRNPAAWRGNLDKVLPGLAEIHTTKHLADRGLHHEEMPEFMQKLREQQQRVINGGWDAMHTQTGRMLLRPEGVTFRELQAMFSPKDKLWGRRGSNIKQLAARAGIILRRGEKLTYYPDGAPAGNHAYRWYGTLDPTAHRYLPARSVGECLELLILTVVRLTNALGARWQDFDLDNRLWIIPGQLMKGRKGKTHDHVVPLSDAVMDLLARLPREEGQVYLFPHEYPRYGKPRISTPEPHLDASHLKRVLVELGHLKRERFVLETPRHYRRVGGQMKTQKVAWRQAKALPPHSFRGTFDTWAQEAGFRERIIDMTLAHSVGSQVDRSYDRSLHLPERAELLQKWATFLATPQEAIAGNVVKFRREGTSIKRRAV